MIKVYRYKNMDKIDIEKDGQNKHFFAVQIFSNIGIFPNIGICKSCPLRRPCIDVY